VRGDTLFFTAQIGNNLTWTDQIWAAIISKQAYGVSIGAMRIDRSLHQPVSSRWDLLAAVAASTSLAAIGWGLLVAVVSRTMEQATVTGGVGNILAAALGGIMVPRFVMPESMQPWAALSPMAWALDGFHAVILRQGSLADIALPSAKLLGLAAAFLAAALWLHQRRRT